MVSDERILMDGQGGDFQFTARGAHVEGLDVFKNVNEIVRPGVNLGRELGAIGRGEVGEWPPHERVVRVRGVADVDGFTSGGCGHGL